jgi:two-component system sensor histidine kinase PhoQ
MSQSVEYQLQRAAAAGRTALIAPVPVEPVVQKVIASLSKAYHQKGVTWSVEIAPSTLFHGDQGDFMEVIGNLIDNAFKWAQFHVVLHAFSTKNGGGSEAGLVIEVDDDGPGIPTAKLSSILHRGIRADPDIGGHGIGLAVVRQIVEEIYRGDISFDRGPLGGTRVRVQFPG